MKFSNADKLITAGFAAWGAVIAYCGFSATDIFTTDKKEKNEIKEKNTPVWQQNTDSLKYDTLKTIFDK